MRSEGYGIEDAFQDDKFTTSTIDSILEYIGKGYDPIEAAAAFSVGQTKLKNWMGNPDFRQLIDMAVAKRDGKLKETITEAMNNAKANDDYKEAANIAMKFLGATNKSFGKKHIEISDDYEDLERPDRDYDSIIEEATEVSNNTPVTEEEEDES